MNRDTYTASIQPLSREEQLAWDIYYASICAMGLHPGNIQRHDGIQLESYAMIADEMLMARRRRIACPG